MEVEYGVGAFGLRSLDQCLFGIIGCVAILSEHLAKCPPYSEPGNFLTSYAWKALEHSGRRVFRYFKHFDLIRVRSATAFIFGWRERHEVTNIWGNRSRLRAIFRTRAPS